MSKEEIAGDFCDFREKGSRYMFCRFCGKETPDENTLNVSLILAY